jgi:hypothetical protein
VLPLIESLAADSEVASEAIEAITARLALGDFA